MVFANDNQRVLYNALRQMTPSDFSFSHDAGSRTVRLGISITRLNALLAKVGEQEVYRSGSKTMWMSEFSVGIEGNSLIIASKIKARYKPNKYVSSTVNGKQKSAVDLTVENGHIIFSNLRIVHLDIKNPGRLGGL